MKKIYRSKLFIFSVLAFVSMNVFGIAYAEEDIEDIEEIDNNEVEIEVYGEVEINQEVKTKKEVKEVMKDKPIKENIKVEVVSDVRSASIPTELERFFIEGSSIAGETHTIKADVRSSKKILYRFYETNLSTNEVTIIQDYSEKSSTDWVPKRKGDYLYGVDIKEVGSKADSDISKNAPIKIEPSIPAELYSLNIEGTNEIRTPHKVIVGGSSVNGILYKFHVKDEITGKWIVLQDYSEKNTITWIPEKAGSYNFSIHAKDKKSFESREATISNVVEIVPLKPAVIKSLEMKGNLYADNNHTLVANATSTNGVLYKFYIKDLKTGKLTILQDYSEKNTAIWKPKKNGQYTYYAAVKDKKSEKNRDDIMSHNVIINPPVHYKTTQYKDTFQEALSKQNGVKSQNGKWVKASKDEIAQYLNPDRFLQFKPNAKEGHLISVEIKANTLNVRRQADVKSDIIATVSKGNVYVVAEEKNGWHKINVNGKIGWVHGDYVQYVNDVPKDMYQFMVLSGQVGVTASQMNNELKDKGILEGKGASFISGSKKYNINELYLMAHSLLETGNGKSELARGIMVSFVDGKPVPPRMVYNMYGIGAFDRDPRKFGSERAYTEGWFTPELAITEGAKWISNSYINHPSYQQDTIYKMRFNPEKPGTHQYATDIAWAYKQITRIDSIMQYTKRMEGVVLRFDIPKYK